MSTTHLHSCDICDAQTTSDYSFSPRGWWELRQNRELRSDLKLVVCPKCGEYLDATIKTLARARKAGG
jgi:hypothetical protein